MSGKGSKRRPAQVSREEIADAWEKTFGRGDAKATPKTKEKRNA